MLRELGDLLDLDVPTVAGGTLRDVVEHAENWRPDVVRPVSEPLRPAGRTRRGDDDGDRGAQVGVGPDRPADLEPMDIG